MFTNRIKNIFIPFLILSMLLFPFIFVDKGTYVLLINKLHNNLLDRVFIFLSAIGNGVTIAICAIILLITFKFKVIYEFFIAFAIQLSIVTLFKQVIFLGLPRPYRFFKDIGQEHLVNLVDNVQVHNFNTFPSGHTATIFLVATFFALLYNRKTLSFTLFVFAFFVGLSRIYLVQHFFIDVYFGLLFGSISAFLAHYFVSKKDYSWFDKRLFINLSGTKKKTQSRVTT